MTQYINYSIPSQVHNINLFGKQNDDIPQMTVFPQQVYRGYPQPVPDLCDRPRDISTNYIIGAERCEHPRHYSTYGRDTCTNGYCFGTKSAGGYILSDAECNPCDIENGKFEPQGVAPKRFYKPPFTTAAGISATYNETSHFRKYCELPFL